jgi:hypothetical protein
MRDDPVHVGPPRSPPTPLRTAVAIYVPGRLAPAFLDALVAETKRGYSGRATTRATMVRWSIAA